jgi:hypothetical protein
MDEIITPSSIIGTFVREVEREFPESETAKLAAHEAAIAKTTTEQDAHRARLCARWAITKAEEKSSEHPRWQGIKEAHQIWRDIIFGMEYSFGVGPDGGSLGSKSDAEIQWTEGAVHVAKALADEDGWASVPWEDLLVSLIDA